MQFDLTDLRLFVLVAEEANLTRAATRQQIAREWPRWYAANRALIGPNPHLIRVGQVLTVPGATS